MVIEFWFSQRGWQYHQWEEFRIVIRKRLSQLGQKVDRISGRGCSGGHRAGKMGTSHMETLEGKGLLQQVYRPCRRPLFMNIEHCTQQMEIRMTIWDCEFGAEVRRNV